MNAPGAPIQHTTDSTGDYSFTGLADGTYTVKFTAPTGYAMVASQHQVLEDLDATPGPTAIDNEGAYQPSTVNGNVFFDADWDSIQDNGEHGLQDVTVTLQSDSGGSVFDIYGNPVNPAITDANGVFTFPPLPAGTYTVQLSAPTNYSFEGPGIPTYLASYTVGKDAALQLGAYWQAATDNPPAQPGQKDGVDRLKAIINQSLAKNTPLLSYYDPSKSLFKAMDFKSTYVPIFEVKPDQLKPILGPGIILPKHHRPFISCILDPCNSPMRIKATLRRTSPRK